MLPLKGTCNSPLDPYFHIVLQMLIVYHAQKKTVKGFYFPISEENERWYNFEKMFLRKGSCLEALPFPTKKKWKYYLLIFCKLDLKSVLQLEIGFLNLVISTEFMQIMSNTFQKRKKQVYIYALNLMISPSQIMNTP